MPIAGTFLQTYRAPDPQQAALHQLDPLHDEPGAEDPNPAWHAEPYGPVAPSPEVVGLEWVTDMPGLLLDRTPEDHDTGGPFTADAGPMQLSAVHNVDLGADEVESRHQPPLQFTSERYDVHEVEGAAAYGVSDVALRRGLDADPTNNPPLASYLGRGYRHGWYRWFSTDRPYREPERVHTHRIVSPQLVTPIGDAPPPDQAGPYNAPFSSLARAIRQLSSSPMVRRVPEPPDVSIIDDGLSQPVELAVADWVSA